MLICPVCGNALTLQERVFRCESGHAFDQAKEGYVNLLRTSKPGDAMGDDKLSARSRRDFLNRGYFAPLRDALAAKFAGARARCWTSAAARDIIPPPWAKIRI